MKLELIKGGRSVCDLTMIRYGSGKKDMRLIIHARIMERLGLRNKLVNVYVDEDESIKTTLCMVIADGLNSVISAHKITLDTRKKKQCGMINSKILCQKYMTDDCNRINFIYKGKKSLNNQLMFVFEGERLYSTKVKNVLSTKLI